MKINSTLFTGKELIKLDSIDSTNSYAAELLSTKKVSEGTAIKTNFQSRGKGYSGNIWESESGKNLLMSVIFYPNFLTPRLQFFLNQVASLAVADTVKEFVKGKEIKIKWPNDVFAGNKKIAGILIENSLKGNTIQHSIIGIGLNVNQKNFSAELLHATSIYKILGKEVLEDEVMHTLFSMLEARYFQLKQNRIEQLQKDYMKNLYRIEEECVYRKDQKRFNAKIVGITAEGKLILQTGNKHEVFGFKEVEMIL